MNTTPLDIRPEVWDFVAAVRNCFADLDPAERDDLLEGLEADVSDLVAERGPEALGDPHAYARELRAAAGLPPARIPARGDGSAGRRITAALDGAHRRWEAMVTDLPGDPWGWFRSLQPAWWVVRAWVAVEMADIVFGSGSYNLGLSPVPSLLGYGWLVLLVAIIGSVQIGRGRWWPGRSGSGGGRLALLALNILAVVVTPVVASQLLTPEKIARWDAEMGNTTSTPQFAMSVSGKAVCNLQPYDAEGNPLQGVQLFDERGRPFDVRCPDGLGTPTAPWLLGDVARRNVFPQAEAAEGSRRFPSLTRLTVPAVSPPADLVKQATTHDKDVRQRDRAEKRSR